MEISIGFLYSRMELLGDHSVFNFFPSIGKISSGEKKEELIKVGHIDDVIE